MPQTSTDLERVLGRQWGNEFAKRPDAPSMSGRPWSRIWTRLTAEPESGIPTSSQEEKMNDLLASAVAAHGGLDRWHQVKSITVEAAVTGALFALKNQADAVKDVRLEVDTTRERLTMDYTGQDKRSVFEPHRVVLQRRDGALIDARDDPERSFDRHQLQTPWDDLHLAYFIGEALWTYLNTPFFYTWPGFVTEEIAPIEAGGETWRRLHVTFPDNVKSHTRQQISCFGPDGLLRRHDFTIDILGGATGMLYATSYRNVDGIIIPTTRRGYAWQGDYQLVPEPLLVAIDMGEITIR
jgi:hypothetical protein